MSMPSRLRASLTAALLFGATNAVAGGMPTTPNLGRPIAEAELAGLTPRIFPDGRGLPRGQGSAATGKPIFAAKCASCHGPEGIGGSGGQLISHGRLTGPDPDPAINNYWPFATTIFDFTRRAMPMTAPGSLSDDEVYALTAYLLNLGGVIGIDDVIDATTLPQVRMPNRDGFDWIDAQRPGAGRKTRRR